MKPAILLFISVFIITISGCSKDDTEKYNFELISNPYVEEYIELLKANQYDSLELPPFTHKDIQALLIYRDAEELELVNDSESHELVSKAYFDWWVNNKQKDFDDYKNIDPLIETDYRWQ